MGDEYKNEEVYVTDHGLPITDHASRNMSHMKDKTVCVVGLWYVGLPLAEAFARHLKVIGYDIEDKKIRELNAKKKRRQLRILHRPF